MEDNKNWTNVHKDFAEIAILSKKTYQQEWESRKLTYQDAKEWVAVGFEPRSYFEVKRWKDFNFTPWEVRTWMNNGLTESEFELAFYLRSKGYKLEGLSFEQAKESSIWQIKKDGIQAQEWLDSLYPKEKRKKQKRLRIYNKNLIGTLDLSDFTGLEELSCSENRLTSLNNLGKKLETIDGWDNNFVGDLSAFSHLINLEELEINNNYFSGSLKFLKNLTKLRRLDISDTDIDSGLEYLPDSIKKIRCSSDEREDAKVKIITQELMKHEKDVQGENEELLHDKNSLNDDESDASSDNSFYLYELQEEAGYNFVRHLKFWREDNTKLLEEIRNKHMEELEAQLQLERETYQELREKINEFYQKTNTDEVKVAFEELDKKCKRLKEENRQLREEIENLEGKIVEFDSKEEITLESSKEVTELVLDYKQLFREINELVVSIEDEQESYKDYCEADFYKRAGKDEKIIKVIKENMDKFEIYKEVVLENKTKKQQVEEIKLEINGLEQQLSNLQIQIPPK